MPTTPDVLQAAIDAATSDLDLESLPTAAEEIDDTAPEDSDEADTDAPDAEEEAEDEQPEDEPEDGIEDEDDEDSDDPEDDVEDDEDDETEDDEEEDEEGTLELDADTVIVLPSGEEITGEELEKSILRQADYTRKTQELAAQRKEIEQAEEKIVAWFEQRTADPSGWISEIAETTDDPDATLAEVIGKAKNPTVALAGVIRACVEGQKLDPKFVEKLGLQHIAEDAKGHAEKRRIDKLEQQLRERDEREQTTQQQKTIIAEYNSQWDTIVETAGLTFDSDNEESAAKVELMKFAREQQITNLVTAWKALAYERQEQATEVDEEPPPAKKRAKETVARKRKAGAISRQSASGGSKPAPARGRNALDAAANAAWDALGLTD